ncbi:calcium-independent phospholipase A2-gamma isoform X2 [Xyrauchen texanus]|uniref:calcium-independent phospholipase A2-gamma isoform X2 n=1 Tax=Xyrauchen texanus TaxID=154827 RepID=UPI002241E9E7|nr:calcium-independent phospholipase A2-gamma isoform X2 [Xyrauchen texanus]
MSRIRSTLVTVTKAVSGTVNTELLSKITRIKPGVAHGKSIEVTVECPDAEAIMTVAEPDPPKGKEVEKDIECHEEPPKSKSNLSTTKGSASSMVAKQTLQLFQPAAFTANMEDAFSQLAEHVNTYFGSDTQDYKRSQQGRRDATPSTTHIQPSSHSIGNKDHVLMAVPLAQRSTPETPLSPPAIEQDGAGPSSQAPSSPSQEDGFSAIPISSRKGISQYLSYPRPSVQAFVGNYITPLVPKFRADSKGGTAEKDKPAESEKPVSQLTKSAETKEQKEADEKAQRLLSQREKEKVIPCLLRLGQVRDASLQASVRQSLALVGYNDPVKGRGIRVLSIDGGGTRGLVALQTLHRLESLTGKPIYQLFDYICGVSTGAILAFMLGVFQIPLNECEKLYRKLGSDVFNQNLIVGTVKMGWSHAFYDSQIWEEILKERMGPGLLIETAKNPKSPKVSAVSTVVNRGLPLKAYVFRNYNFLPGVRSHYLGSCQHKMWQAVRASSAAPGYFQEFVLGNDLHQDGGLLINNPTALAIHESKCLWPNTPVQCVVSLGTGRYETVTKTGSSTYTSLKTKLTNIISSATDTEEVHTMLDALLPPNTYFRFNPYMSEDVPLDERRQERLDILQAEGRRYLERNENKLKKAASVLTQEKSVVQKLAEWAQLKADMYDGLSFGSKL